MLALERRNLILEKLQTERRVVVSELSQLYEVSEETIRRDLDKLEKEGLATKSYGGAVINENVSIDLPFNIRKNQNVGGKQKMAEIVAEMVQDGDHIFLDASTTAVFIAKALKDKERLTVITNSMEILIELSDVSGWNKDILRFWDPGQRKLSVPIMWTRCFFPVRHLIRNGESWNPRSLLAQRKKP